RAGPTGAPPFASVSVDAAPATDPATRSLHDALPTPVANDDSYAAAKNVALTVPAKGVLTNDTDGNGDTLTAVKVTDPSHGSVTLDAEGTRPNSTNAGCTEADGCTYNENDGQLDSNPA